MPRQFVKELNDGDAIDQVFLASEKQLRTNRNGNLYLQLRLSDRTGSTTAMFWNAKESHFESFNNGDFVHVKGTSQLYNGNMQVLVKEVAQADKTKVDEADFVTLSVQKVEGLVARVAELLRSQSNAHLRNLGDCFLMSESFMEGLKAAPAGIKNHHAYRGGLIEHVVSLMEMAEITAGRYPNLDRDLMITGTFLHDLGKIRELTYSPDLGYSNVGQLLGHLVLGVTMLDEMIAETEKQSGENFPEELANHLRHIIVSHHGQYEFGSPKLPMSLEAIAIHHLDNLDAKMHSIQQLVDEDVNKSSPWTTYQPALGRKIYKGS